MAVSPPTSEGYVIASVPPIPSCATAWSGREREREKERERAGEGGGESGGWGWVNKVTMGMHTKVTYIVNKVTHVGNKVTMGMRIRSHTCVTRSHASRVECRERDTSACRQQRDTHTRQALSPLLHKTSFCACARALPRAVPHVLCLEPFSKSSRAISESLKIISGHLGGPRNHLKPSRRISKSSRAISGGPRNHLGPSRRTSKSSRAIWESPGIISGHLGGPRNHLGPSRRPSKSSRAISESLEIISGHLGDE